MADKLQHDEHKWRNYTQPTGVLAGGVIATPAPEEPDLEVTIDKNNRYGSSKKMEVKNPNPSI